MPRLAACCSDLDCTSCSNKLFGNIPQDLSQLSALRFLSLSNNRLGGPLPSWGSWRSLQVRAGQQVHGALPDACVPGSAATRWSLRAGASAGGARDGCRQAASQHVAVGPVSLGQLALRITVQLSRQLAAPWLAIIGHPAKTTAGEACCAFRLANMAQHTGLQPTPCMSPLQACLRHCC